VPAVAVRAQAGDATPDRLELRLAATPEAEEHRRWVVATRDLPPECRAVDGAEDAIGHARPALDLPDPLDVDAYVAEPRDGDEEQLLAMCHAEPESGLRGTRQRRLAVQTQMNRHGGGWQAEEAPQHLPQS